MGPGQFWDWLLHFGRVTYLAVQAGGRQWTLQLSCKGEPFFGLKYHHGGSQCLELMVQDDLQGGSGVVLVQMG